MVSTQFDEETVKKIIRQVEFYFSDSNIPRDNFLRNTIAESEDGMVSLALICSFSRMRGHLGLGDIKVEDVSDDTVEAMAKTLKNEWVILSYIELCFVDPFTNELVNFGFILSQTYQIEKVRCKVEDVSDDTVEAMAKTLKNEWVILSYVLLTHLLMNWLILVLFCLKRIK